MDQLLKLVDEWAQEGEILEMLGQEQILVSSNMHHQWI